MSSKSIDTLIEKLTAENVIDINWDGFVELSDRLKKAPGVHGDAINTIKKRLNNRDPHIVQNAIELLDFLWKNVTVEFRREVSSKKNISELQSKATSSEHQIARKMREKLKQWAEEECKKDPSLSLVESLYRDLLSQGYDFNSKDYAVAAAEKKRKEALLKEEEDRQLREAIQQSLKVSSSNSNTSGANAPMNTTTVQQKTILTERKVQASYDFPAAEDNELSFNAGDIITVLDDSNPHWWRARLNGREGLIPVQFVEEISSKKEEVREQPVAKQEIRARIDEAVLLQTIEALQQCDPTGLRPDPAGLEQLESTSLAQAPLINDQLANIDRLTNMLAKVDMSIRNALAEYDSAVQNSALYQTSQSMGYPPAQMQPQMQMPQANLAYHQQPPQMQPQQQWSSPQIQTSAVHQNIPSSVSLGTPNAISSQTQLNYGIPPSNLQQPYSSGY